MRYDGSDADLVQIPDQRDIPTCKMQGRLQRIPHGLSDATTPPLGTTLKDILAGYRPSGLLACRVPGRRRCTP